MLRPAVAVMNCARAAEAGGVGIGERAPVGERKADPAKPDVTGSQRARPAATRQRQPENSIVAEASASAGLPPPRCSRGTRARARLDSAARHGADGFLAAAGRNPRQIAAFWPYIKSSRGHYDSGCAEYRSRRRSLLLELAGFPWI